MMYLASHNIFAKAIVYFILCILKTLFLKQVGQTHVNYLVPDLALVAICPSYSVLSVQVVEVKGFSRAEKPLPYPANLTSSSKGNSRSPIAS